MFPNLPILATGDIPNALAHRRFLKGTVEKAVDMSTWIVKVGDQHITVKLNNQSLNTGEQIDLTVLNNQLLIKRVSFPHQPPDYNKLPSSDAFTPNSSIPDNGMKITTNREWTPADSVTIISNLKTDLPEGLFKFTNVSDAISFLGLNGNDNTTVQLLDDALQKQSEVLLRTFPSDENESAAIIIDNSEAVRELDSLSKGFSSPTMQSIPPDVLSKLFEERCSIRFDTLQLLDQIFLSTPSQIRSTRAGSIPAQNEVVLQWLNMVHDNNRLLDTSVLQIPSTTASSLATSLDELSYIKDANLVARQKSSSLVQML